MKTSVRFLPLLVFYIIIVLITSTEVFKGDEVSYVGFANNLTHGYYSPRDDIGLWHGPGYPFILFPFALFNLPWIIAKLLNPIFLFIAICYFFNTLRIYIAEKPAFYFSYLLGVYLPFLRYLHWLTTETLALCLICGFLFHFCKLHQRGRTSWLHLVLSSVYLGYLALTKVFFGYVILTGVLFFLVLYLYKRKDILKRTLLVYSLALFCCLPYLFYTYSLTGKVFYWSNAGGNSLYWMTSTYDDELGDWHPPDRLREYPSLYERHKKLFSELEGLSSVERDDELKRRAFNNIAHNPAKFLKNWTANIGRLLFSYPYSYTPQKLSTYFYMAPNIFLVALSILLIYPAYIGRRLIPYEIFALLVFSLISFGGSSFLVAYPRHFTLLVPVFSLWIIFILMRILKLDINR